MHELVQAKSPLCNGAYLCYRDGGSVFYWPKSGGCAVLPAPAPGSNRRDGHDTLHTQIQADKRVGAWYACRCRLEICLQSRYRPRSRVVVGETVPVRSLGSFNQLVRLSRLTWLIRHAPTDYRLPPFQEITTTRCTRPFLLTDPIMYSNEKGHVLKRDVENATTEAPPSILRGSLGPSNGDEARLAQAGYSQELDRTFSLPSLIALSLCLMATYEALSGKEQFSWSTPSPPLLPPFSVCLGRAAYSTSS